MKSRVFFAALVAGLLALAVPRGSAQEQFPYQIFERYLEPLRQQIGMPGLSALIVQDGKMAWEKSYGFADVEHKIPARYDTPYPIGGVTQAVTGVMMGVCIDRFGLEIDRDIRSFVPTFPFPETSIRQVLAHATNGRFRYDPALYSMLTPIIESKECFNQTFRQATTSEILKRLVMPRSVPGLDLARAEGAPARPQFEPD